MTGDTQRDSRHGLFRTITLVPATSIIIATIIGSASSSKPG